MKASLLALLFIPFASLAQQDSKAPAAKPSTTACPDFKNKTQVSKAAYFESLRHTKAAKVQPTASAQKAKPEVPAQTAKTPTAKTYVPAFATAPDKVMEVKKAPEVVPAVQAEKTESKPEEVKEKAMMAENSTKPRSEKKAAKKKNNACKSGKTRTSKRNPEKCPAF
jgi:hypothetical protein